MAADLGIDSIKRVEILTSFARQFPNLGAAVPEQPGTARTLQDVAQVMRENLNVGAATAPPERETPAPARPPVPEITSQPRPMAVASAPASSAPANLLQQLVSLVAERTGYPVEALAPEQDMEADLGIDSIKRVEILTSFARQFPNLGAAVPEQLRAARTLQDVVQVMRENLNVGAATAPPERETPAPARPPVPEITSQPRPMAVA